jgi:tRNA1Val (adenine37-N6)-methyltransferase
MPNTYFQFKQFRINQEHCAMKVSTEACILGASIHAEKPKNILDIGTGTGLLALMLAQQFEGDIDAIEIDSATADQAKENVAQSPWSEQIEIINESIFYYAERVEKTYDLIVSNPPFFTDGLRSPDPKINLARHDSDGFDKLSFARVLDELLTDEGNAYIIYPEQEYEEFKWEVMAIGLYCQPALIIRNQPNKPIFRIVASVSKTEILSSKKELNIRNGNEHTSAFNELMQPYYLKL